MTSTNPPAPGEGAKDLPMSTGPAHVPPRERFARPAIVVDLAELAAELRRQPGAGGHRQQVIYRHGALTCALFVFEAGGLLADHRAAGTITIQGLEGELEVVAEGTVHTLRPGTIITLAPDVPHEVRAPRAGTMILHISLEPAAAG